MIFKNSSYILLHILFKDIFLYDDFISGSQTEYSALFPTREQVGEIYKYILGKKVLSDRIKYVFLNSIGFAKTSVALKTLEELGLIVIGADGFIYASSENKKTNLMNSPTYKYLSERSGRNE